MMKLEELPDRLANSEALWMLGTLSYAWALREAYRTITKDEKAWRDADRACEATMKLIRRIYPEAEAAYLIQKAQAKGAEAALKQKQIEAEG